VSYPQRNNETGLGHKETMQN